MDIAIKNAMSLALASLSPFERKDGWNVGYSDRENSVYFHNQRTSKTQWESPTTGVKFPVPRGHDEAGCGRLSRKYQVPKLPNFPKGLKRARTPDAAVSTKDICNSPESPNTQILQLDDDGEHEVRRSQSVRVDEDGEDGEPPQKKSKKEQGIEMKFDNPTLPDTLGHPNTIREQVENYENVQQQEMFDFPDDVWYYRHIGDKRFAVVKTFKQKVYVNIREYYKSPYSGSRMIAGKRGLNLTVENWKQLAHGVEDISAAVKAQELCINQ